jgi:hypothetical protein
MFLGCLGRLGVELGHWLGVLWSCGARPVVIWLLVLSHMCCVCGCVFVLVFVGVCVCGVLFCTEGICPPFLLLNTMMCSSHVCLRKKINATSGLCCLKYYRKYSMKLCVAYHCH